MALKYEAKARIGTYKNQAGEEKPNWVKVGAVFETANGMSMKMESIPVGFDGWISFFDPKPRQANTPSVVQSAGVNLSDIDSDIPF